MELLESVWAQYEREIWMLSIASALMLAMSAMLIPYLIARLPADFYAENNHRRRLFERRPLLRAVFLVVKNTVGAVLLIAGIAMLVLPGQGILTILAALALINFPGKRSLEMRILHRPAVLRTANWLRRRAGREPLTF